jgi:hypothetical protein
MRGAIPSLQAKPDSGFQEEIMRKLQAAGRQNRSPAKQPHRAKK